MTHNRRSFLKLFGSASTGLVLASGLSAIAGRAAAQDKILWKALTNHRLGAVWSVRWAWLLEDLKARTNGQIDMQVSTLQELGYSGSEIIRSLRSNIVDFADLTVGYAAGDIPAIEAVQLPGVYTGTAQIRQAMDIWTDKVIRPRENVIGGKLISTFNYNSIYLFSNFPMDDLANLSGKKIRVFSTAMADYIAGLGGEPVTMALSEVYSALQRGAIDGVCTGPDQVDGSKLYEVTTHITDLRLGASPAYSVVSSPSWDRLPGDLKADLEDMSGPLTDKGWEAGDTNNKTGLDLAIEKGMTVTESAKPEWDEQIKKVATEVAKAWSNRSGAEVTKAFNEVLSPVVGITI